LAVSERLAGLGTAFVSESADFFAQTVGHYLGFDSGAGYVGGTDDGGRGGLDHKNLIDRQFASGINGAFVNADRGALLGYDLATAYLYDCMHFQSSVYQTTNYFLRGQTT
jgi:hypothetical protein